MPPSSALVSSKDSSLFSFDAQMLASSENIGPCPPGVHISRFAFDEEMQLVGRTQHVTLHTRARNTLVCSKHLHSNDSATEPVPEITSFRTRNAHIEAPKQTGDMVGIKGSVSQNQNKRNPQIIIACQDLDNHISQFYCKL